MPAEDTGPTGMAGGSPHAERDQQVAAAAARRVRALAQAYTQLSDRVAGLGADVRTGAARHTELAAAVSEELGPRLQDLSHLLAEEVGGLRRDVDALLHDRREQDKTRNRPLDWAGLTGSRPQRSGRSWPGGSARCWCRGTS